MHKMQCLIIFKINKNKILMVGKNYHCHEKQKTDHKTLEKCVGRAII